MNQDVKNIKRLQIPLIDGSLVILELPRAVGQYEMEILSRLLSSALETYEKAKEDCVSIYAILPPTF